MPRTVNLSPRGGGSDWDHWELQVRAFDRAWKEGQRPVLDDFLPPEATAQDRVLVELVHTELEHRLKAGEPVRIEDYLVRYPQLRDDSTELISLIAAEFEHRQPHEPGLLPEEYQGRFPDLAAVLAERLVAQPPSPFASPLEGLEVVRELGRGGMGIVYLARQTALNRLVALKVLPPGPQGHAESRARFEGEARALAALQHPHIVPVHASGVHHGVPYLILDYVAGQTLAQHLAGRPRPAAEAVALLAPLVDAMQHAHQQRVVHRDLKPANVLLDVDGTPRVTDFGLAKQLDEPGPTRTGQVLGTLAYMAPEQAAGRKDLGPAVDIYALGAILYECLAGCPPFLTEGKPLREVLRQIIEDEPRAPSCHASRVPRELDLITLKCLEKDPARRYASAQDLAEDLARWRQGEPIQARPPRLLRRLVRSCRRRPARALLAGLLALLVMALAVWRHQARRFDHERSWWKEEQARAAGRERDQLRQQARLDLQDALDRASRAEPGPALLWFARALAHAEVAEDAEETTRVRQSMAMCRSLLHPLRATRTFSDRAFALGAGRVDLTLVTGGPLGPRAWRAGGDPPIAGPGGEGPVVAAAARGDGQVLVISQRPGQAARGSLWAPHTGKTAVRVALPPGEALAATFHPRGAPVLAVAGAGGNQTTILLQAAEGDWRRVARFPARALSLAISPDGQALAAGCADGKVRLFDSTGGAAILPWAAPGRDRAPYREVPSLPHARAVGAVAFSPDGKHLLTGSDDQTARIWYWQSLRPHPVGAALLHPAAVQAVAFTPDGRGAWTASADGGLRRWDVAPLPPPLRHNNAILAVAYRPDGKALFTNSAGGHTRVWSATAPYALLRSHRHSVRERKPGQRMVPISVEGIDFSPDGQYYATASGSAQQPGRVQRHRTDTGALVAEQDHLAGTQRVAFSGEGRHLLVGTYDGLILRLDATHLRAIGPPLRNDQPVGTMSLAPDQSVLLTASDTTARVWRWSEGTFKRTCDLWHESKVTLVACCPKGRSWLTATEGGTAYLWDPRSRQRLRALGHGDPVAEACFSGDGRLVLTAGGKQGQRGSARLWDAESGRPLGPALTHPDLVYTVAFSPDGKSFLTGCYDWCARGWDLPPPRGETSAWLAGWAEVITGSRLDAAAQVVPLTIRQWRQAVQGQDREARQ